MQHATNNEFVILQANLQKMLGLFFVLYTTLAHVLWLSSGQLFVKAHCQFVTNLRFALVRVCWVQGLSSLAFVFIQPLAVANPPFV